MREKLVVSAARLLAEVPPGVQSGGGWRQVHTHLRRCTRSRRAPVSPPQPPPTHRRRLLPTRASSPCPCPTPLPLRPSALLLAETTHAAVALEQRLQLLPPRASLPSALGLAVSTHAPRTCTLSSPRIRCCEKTVGFTSLLALRTDDSPELTLSRTTTGTRAAPGH
jgi:hypothetical protein